MLGASQLLSYNFWTSLRLTLGWTVEYERFVLCGVAEYHVFTRRIRGELLHLGFRNLKTFRCSLPHVGSVLHFENV